MKDTSITFKLRENEKEQLKKLAIERDIPLSQLIREIIKEHLKEVN